MLNITHRTSFYELHLFSKNYNFNRPTINEEGVSYVHDTQVSS